MRTDNKNKSQLDDIFKMFRVQENLQGKKVLPQICRNNQKIAQATNQNRDKSANMHNLRQNYKSKIRSLSSTQYIVTTLNTSQNQQQMQLKNNQNIFINKTGNDELLKNSNIESLQLNKTFDVQLQAQNLKQLQSHENNILELQQNQILINYQQSPNEIKTQYTQIQDQLQNSLKFEKNQDNIQQSQLISQRKKPKGPNTINIKVLEQWINDTILEAQTGDTQNIQGPQKVIKKSGLNSFSIDRKNLQSKGISIENIDRMYRCLFVYSFGFYEMLYSIFQHAQDKSILMANIWKVYGILLENCSRSDFQVTISVLEKEKKVYEQQMETQINKKEKLISEIQDRDNLERDRLMNELKQLNIQRENLEIEKQQIEEDFKQADQAFNEELKLRLKFEHRINELHSIYKEILIQHERLLQDFLQQKNEKVLMQSDIKEYREKLVELSNVNNNLTQNLKQQDMTLIHKQNENQILTERIQILEKKVEEKNLLEQSKANVILDYERTIEDFKFKQQNQQNQLSTLKKTIKDLNEYAYDLIKDKQNQNSKIKEQQKENEQLRFKIHELEQQSVISNKEIEQFQKKAEEQIQINKNQEDQYQICSSQIKKLDVDLDFNKQRIIIQESDIKAMDHVILDMKLARNELEDQYIKMRVKLENSLEELRIKTEQVKNLDIDLSEKEKINYQLIIDLNQLKEHINSEKKFQTKKMTIIHQQNEQLQYETEKKSNELNDLKKNHSKVLQVLEKHTQDLSESQQQLKNQQFIIENNNQQICTLKSVLESERARIDIFVEQLGKLQIQKEELQQENKSLQYINRESKENYEYNLKKFQERNILKLKKCKYDYQTIHYMQFEDVQSDLMRNQSKFLQSQMEKSQVQENYKNLNLKYLNLQKNFDICKNEKSQVQENYKNLNLKYLNLEENFDICKNDLIQGKNDLILSHQQIYKKDNLLNILILRQKKLSFRKEQDQISLDQLYLQIEKLSQKVINLNEKNLNLQQINEMQIKEYNIIKQSYLDLEKIKLELEQQQHTQKKSIDQQKIQDQNIKSLTNISQVQSIITQKKSIDQQEIQEYNIKSQNNIIQLSSQKMNIQQESNNSQKQIQNINFNQNLQKDHLIQKIQTQNNEKQNIEILKEQLHKLKQNNNNSINSNDSLIQEQINKNQLVIDQNIDFNKKLYTDPLIQKIQTQNNEKQKQEQINKNSLVTDQNLQMKQDQEEYNKFQQDKILNFKDINNLLSHEIMEYTHLNQPPTLVSNRQISVGRNLNQQECSQYQYMQKQDIYQEFEQNNFQEVEDQQNQFYLNQTTEKKVQNLDSEFYQYQTPNQFQPSQQSNYELQDNKQQHEEQKCQQNEDFNDKNDKNQIIITSNQGKRQNYSRHERKYINPNEFSRQFQITSQFYSCVKKQ